MTEVPRLLRLALLGLIALPLGCSDGTVEYTNEGVKEDDSLEGAGALDTSTVAYVQSQQELRSRLNAQSEVIWAPDRAFSGVVLHLSSSGVVELEYATQAPDGTRSVFQAAEVSDPERQDFMVHIALAQPARALVLRVNQGAESIDFIRAEFLHEVGLDGHVHSDDDIDVEAIYDGTFKAAVSKPGRYEPSAGALERAGQNPPRRDEAPAWSARTCTAGDYNFENTTAGAKALAAYIRGNFEGVRSIGGFGCRPNSANTSRLSVHGTGRALDVMLPLSGGKADNTLGDKIAEFVIMNATEIGVQTVIWDNTIWSSTNPGVHRYYGDKSNVTLRHEDHLHIEINLEAAGNGTPWFRDQSVAINPPTPAAGGPGALTGRACQSKTLGRQVPAGESVQMNYASSCGGRCSWSTCNDGSWQCAGQPAATAHLHPSCLSDHGSASGMPSAPLSPPFPPARSSCFSRTLNTSVSDGVCVQMSYAACGGSCRFAVCRDGGWACTEEASCPGEKKRHANCSPPAPVPAPSPGPQGAACQSKTLGMSVPAGSCVQMSYDACGGTCAWASCTNGQWTCGGGQSSCQGQAFPHNACGGGGGGGGTGPAPGPSKTVDQLARERGCTSSVVNGLSTQLVEELNCLEPGLLKSFAGQPNLRLGAAVFPFLQSGATDNLVRAVGARSMGINSALRTIPQQYLLYRWQGSCGISVAASPGRSNHNGGLAIDTSDYTAMKATLGAHGWKWFGPGDKPHFDHAGRDIRALSVKAFQRLWNRNNPNDRIGEDGDYGAQTEARLKRAPSNGFAQGASCAGARSAALPVQPGLLVEAFDLDVLGPALELHTLVPEHVRLIQYEIDGILLGQSRRDGEQGAFKALLPLPQAVLDQPMVTVTALAFGEEGQRLGQAEVVVDRGLGLGLRVQNWGWGSYQLKVATPPPQAQAVALRAQDGSFIELEYLHPEDPFDLSFSLRAHLGQRLTLQFLSAQGEVVEEQVLPMSFEM